MKIKAKEYFEWIGFGFVVVFNIAVFIALVGAAVTVLIGAWF